VISAGTPGRPWVVSIISMRVMRGTLPDGTAGLPASGRRQRDCFARFGKGSIGNVKPGLDAVPTIPAAGHPQFARGGRKP